MILSEKVDDPDLIIKKASAISPHGQPDQLFQVSVVKAETEEDKKEEPTPQSNQIIDPDRSNGSTMSDE